MTPTVVLRRDHRRALRRRRVPAARAQPDPGAARLPAARQRDEPAVAVAAARPGGPPIVGARRADDERPAPAGHGPDRHRHHVRDLRVPARDDLPVLAARPARRGRRTTSRTAGIAAAAPRRRRATATTWTPGPTERRRRRARRRRGDAPDRGCPARPATDADRRGPWTVQVLAPLPVVLPLLAARRSRSRCAAPGTSAHLSVVALSLVLAVARAARPSPTRRCSSSTPATGRHRSVINLVAGPARCASCSSSTGSRALMLVRRRVVLARRLFSPSARAPPTGRRDAGLDLPPDVPGPRRRVANAFLAGDLFNLYVGFEMLLAASYVLHHPGRHRVADPRRDRSTSWSRCSPR